MDLNWYAIKVFWNRTVRIREIMDELGLEYYAQKVMPSYMFIHTDEQTALRFRASQFGFIYMYADRKDHKPIVVSDKEMEIFRIVTSAPDPKLEFLGEDPSIYMVGDRVRVKDGPLKGAEGYVRRIRKDRRLVVVISGVVAMATSFIPPQLLEKVEA